MELNLKESYNLLKTLIKEHWVIYDCPGGLELITNVHLKTILALQLNQNL